MCTCEPDNYNNNNQEEYYTALSEFEELTPEDRLTSTRYEEEFFPEYVSTPKLTRNYQRGVPRGIRTSRRHDLTSGVAVVPRRIDFDAVSDVEEVDIEEDMDATRLSRMRGTTRPTYISEPTLARRRMMMMPPGLRRTRMTQYPSGYKQYTPRTARITPYGKYLRI